MTIFLDESTCRQGLFPFTQTRHTSEISAGILTIKEKWELLTGANVLTAFPATNEEVLHIEANIIPTQKNFEKILKVAREKTPAVDSAEIKTLRYPWQIFQYNDSLIREDFALLTRNRKSQAVSPTNKIINEAGIFLEEGASVEHSILNADTGPVYIGKNAVIMEGNLIRGPFALGKKSVLKMGSRIYGATTIGHHCLAGGEIKNSVLFEYSNKAHEGYLGDSVIGAWCNLGAGTNNSNVKNTAGSVLYYLEQHGEGINAGNKAGLLMGDYSRCAINTSFNTGTVVGVCCNIFGENIPSKHVANFSWGNDRYIFEKALRDIGNWKKMKQEIISEAESKMLLDLYSINL